MAGTGLSKMRIRGRYKVVKNEYPWQVQGCQKYSKNIQSIAFQLSNSDLSFSPQRKCTLIELEAQ